MNHPHLTPIVGAQPLPAPHEPEEMGENVTEVKLSMRGASWFMSKLKANWTAEEHAAELLRRQNEALARKIKSEATKVKPLWAVIAAIGLSTASIGAADNRTPVASASRLPSPSLSLGENFGSNRRGLTTTLTASAGVDHPSLPSPTLLVGENFERVAERQTLSKHGDNSRGESAARKSYALTGSTPVSLKFLNAVAMVESSRNPKAIGDGGKATGEFQLHQAARIDAKRYLGRDGTDRELARAYFQWLQSRFVKRYGKQPTYAELYQAYNRGFGNAARDGFDLSKAPVVTQRACRRIEGMMK